MERNLNLSKLLACLCSAFLLQACGTVSNRYSPAELPTGVLSSGQSGVVLVSTGAPQHCISTATFILATDAKTKKATDPIVYIGVDAYAHKSDFNSHHGLVSAFSLQPGSYYFAPAIANPFVRGVKIPTFNFDVRAGETTYVGELFMPTSCSLATSFQVNDMFERDWAIALAKNPGLATRTPVKRLMIVGEPLGKQ
jgi:hypothetical protein